MCYGSLEIIFYLLQDGFTSKPVVRSSCTSYSSGRLPAPTLCYLHSRAAVTYRQLVGCVASLDGVWWLVLEQGCLNLRSTHSQPLLQITSVNQQYISGISASSFVAPNKSLFLSLSLSFSLSLSLSLCRICAQAEGSTEASKTNSLFRLSASRIPVQLRSKVLTAKSPLNRLAIQQFLLSVVSS